jgi:hypothetical protein
MPPKRAYLAILAVLIVFAILFAFLVTGFYAN